MSCSPDAPPLTFAAYQMAAARTMNRAAPLAPANYAMGLAGETGEVVELLKKRLFHGIDPGDKLVKELGDVLWYVAALCEEMGLTLEQVARVNIDKLMKRYPDGFVLGGGER